MCIRDSISADPSGSGPVRQSGRADGYNDWRLYVSGYVDAGSFSKRRQEGAGLFNRIESGTDHSLRGRRPVSYTHLDV